MLPFVLRIPAAWSGGLVTFRHGAAGLALWEELEAALGSRSVGRIFHETTDRMVSDVALHPERRWAFFAVNYVGVAPGGVHNTLIVGGEPGCTEGTPTQGIVDVTTTRDHALLARHLLKTLRGREPSMVLGVGHSAGTTVHMLLNAGVDHRRAGVVQPGDNHLTPYDAASGRIFDGFLSLQGGAGAPLGAALTSGVSVPTIFLNTDVDRPGTLGAINGINEMVLNPALNVPNLIRLYTVSNMPHIDSDFVLSAVRPGSDFTDPASPQVLPGRRRSAQAADRRAARCAGAVGKRRHSTAPVALQRRAQDRTRPHRVPSDQPVDDGVSSRGRCEPRYTRRAPQPPRTAHARATRRRGSTCETRSARQSARLRCPKRRAAAAGSTSSEQAQLALR